jgi:general secretion pathway protein G
MTEPKKPLSKQERKRKIKQIYRDMEARKRALGLKAPAIKRGPVFYFVVLMAMAMIGGALIQAAGKGGGKKMRDGAIVRAEQSVAALAEALGRYKFHCGVYPTAEEGLEALVKKQSRHAGWIGPYIASPRYDPTLLPDPWKHPYVYEPTNDPPVVLSLGPDGVRGTPDDIAPDPDLFTKPFRDTTWTNDWAPFHRRGYYIVPGNGERGTGKGEREGEKNDGP